MRALQPPFLAFVQSIVPVEKWDAAKTRSVLKKQAWFFIAYSGYFALMGTFYFFNPRMTWMGFGYLALALLFGVVSTRRLRMLLKDDRLGRKEVGS